MCTQMKNSQYLYSYGNIYSIYVCCHSDNNVNVNFVLLSVY